MTLEALKAMDEGALRELSKKITWLADRAAIEDALARYARGIDRCDTEMLKSVFHDDATDEHGIYSGSGHGFAETITPFIRDSYVTMQHHHTTTSIEIEGDMAFVETYFICYILRPDEKIESLSGRTLDRFEKRNDRWAIATRQVVMDWTCMINDVEKTENDPLFIKGTFKEGDMSYKLRDAFNG